MTLKHESFFWNSTCHCLTINFAYCSVLLGSCCLFYWNCLSYFVIQFSDRSQLLNGYGSRSKKCFLFRAFAWLIVLGSGTNFGLVLYATIETSMSFLEDFGDALSLIVCFVTFAIHVVTLFTFSFHNTFWHLWPRTLICSFLSSVAGWAALISSLFMSRDYFQFVDNAAVNYARLVAICCACFGCLAVAVVMAIVFYVGTREDCDYREFDDAGTSQRGATTADGFVIDTDLSNSLVNLVINDRHGCWPVDNVLFLWVNRLMVKGYRSQLSDISSLFQLPSDLNTDSIAQRFGANMVCSSHCLHKALHRQFGPLFYLIGILKLVSDLMLLASPILLNRLVNFMENAEEPMRHGYIYAGILFGCTLVNAVCSVHFGYQVNKIVIAVRSALVSAVYAKLHKVSLAEFGLHHSTGEVMNFFSTDTERVVNYCQSFHAVWSLPFQVVVALYLLYQQVGLSFVAGIGFAILLVPINRYIAVKIGQLSTVMMAQKDIRVRMIGEVLSGIRAVKLGGWENVFTEKIGISRRAEVHSLKGRKYLDALCVYFWASAPVVISILTFVLYVLLGHKLTAARVFTSMALFNILMVPLNAFPWVLNGLVESWISLKRLQAFLNLDEMDLGAFYRDNSVSPKSVLTSRQRDEIFVGSSMEAIQAEGGHLVQLTNADFCWKTKNGFHLRDLTFSLRRGEFVGVVGAVGSGKSSLFSAILAEMYKMRGSVHWPSFGHGAALFRQTPWLQSGTVRENIIFGKQFEAHFYEQVISMCALESDLRLMSQGDLSEVGEQGSALSGGQKARVALARAIYQDTDFCLLDDPFAAVDVKVARHLLENCISNLIYRKKTVLLATHQTHLLNHADRIMVLQNGEILIFDTPKVVMQKYPEHFSKSIEIVSAESTSGDAKSDLVNGGEFSLKNSIDLGGDEPVFCQEEEKEVFFVH